MTDQADSGQELRLLFEQTHRLSAQLKNLAFASESNPVLIAARSVLHLLDQNGAQTVPALAQSRNSSRQNVQIIVDRLQRMGWVEFRDNPRHKRSRLVQLTADGGQALADSETEEEQMLQLLTSRFSNEQVQTSLDLLQRISSSIMELNSVRAVGSPSSSRQPTRKAAPQVIRPYPQALADEHESEIEESSLPVNLL